MPLEHKLFEGRNFPNSPKTRYIYIFSNMNECALGILKEKRKHKIP